MARQRSPLLVTIRLQTSRAASASRRRISPAPRARVPAAGRAPCPGRRTLLRAGPLHAGEYSGGRGDADGGRVRCTADGEPTGESGHRSVHTIDSDVGVKPAGLIRVFVVGIARLRVRDLHLCHPVRRSPLRVARVELPSPPPPPGCEIAWEGRRGRVRRGRVRRGPCARMCTRTWIIARSCCTASARQAEPHISAAYYIRAVYQRSILYQSSISAQHIISEQYISAAYYIRAVYRRCISYQSIISAQHIGAAAAAFGGSSWQWSGAAHHRLLQLRARHHQRPRPHLGMLSLVRSLRRGPESAGLFLYLMHSLS